MRFKVLALFLSGCFIAMTARAQFDCTGPVSSLALSPNGTVQVSVGTFGVWYLCELSNTDTYGGVTFTTDGCKGIYAMLLTAQSTGNSVTMDFSSSDSGGTNGADCTALGSWVQPSSAPYYIYTLGNTQ